MHCCPNACNLSRSDIKYNCFISILSTLCNPRAHSPPLASGPLTFCWSHSHWSASDLSIRRFACRVNGLFVFSFKCSQKQFARTLSQNRGEKKRKKMTSACNFADCQSMVSVTCGCESDSSDFDLLFLICLSSNFPCRETRPSALRYPTPAHAHRTALALRGPLDRR